MLHNPGKTLRQESKKVTGRQSEASPSMRNAIARMLRPRSIAIVGASATPGALGHQVLESLERFKYAGDIHLVNPNRTQVAGRPCVRSVSNLPVGVDCAVMAIPSSGVAQAIVECAQRGVGGVVLFSAGFAEAGNDGRAAQEEIAKVARAHGMAIEGPNCSGLVNYVDGVPLTFASATLAPRLQGLGLGLVSQSGAAGTALRNTLLKREVQVSFSISTGNEAVNGVEDFLDFLVDDPNTRVLALIVEQFRNPTRFLGLARRAHSVGKPMVLLHTGRSAGARMAAQTHTGALTGDYNVMRALVASEGVALVETFEELTDVAELLMCCRSLPKGGAALISDSGALKALALDICEAEGLELPALSPESEVALKAVLPEFIPPSNPLDLTAQALVEPGLYAKTMGPLLADDRYGSLVMGMILGNAAVSRVKVPLVLDKVRELGTTKPVILAMFGEEADVPADLISQMRSQGVPFFRSPERLLRALARLTAFAGWRPPNRSPAVVSSQGARLPQGVVPEYMAKGLLAQAGLGIPSGALVLDVVEAQRVASRIGYPVVLKAQAVALSHKSDAGGVVLGLQDPDSLAAGWVRLHAQLARTRPGIKLDGVLVETMARPGLELILGARNDPDWGPLLMVGLGGVWAEALKDVRVLPADLAPDAIVAELNKLKGAVMLGGFRGSPAVDVGAVAQMASRLGAFILGRPEIVEIDVNPVVVYPDGEGAVALDALIVAR
jgi:acyl-CoA synthetase (NDP forming)